MADYGTSTQIPNGTSPDDLTTPTPSPQVPDSHPFNQEALQNVVDQVMSQGTSPQGEPQTNQFSQSDVQGLQNAIQNNPNVRSGAIGPDLAAEDSGVNAIGRPGDIAQSYIGRNVNERLQIWSKLVGNNNAMLGPSIGGQEDVWIRGKDDKFHPADVGHTDFMQDLAKKTGLGIDMMIQGFSGLVGGSIASTPGAIIGYGAGSGLSSAGRQFLMSRFYDVHPGMTNDGAFGAGKQFTRDLYIGGALNMLTAGVFNGLGNAGYGVADAMLNSPSAKMANLADSQLAAKNFFDAVGAQPISIIDSEGNINAPMKEAGERLWSATELKNKQMNALIGSANDQIVAASNNKVNTSGLASVVKQFMQKDGYKFDDNGMPIPYQDVPLYAQPAGGLEEPYLSTYKGPFGKEAGSVNQAYINPPKMGTEAMNTLAQNYKALASGQMDIDGFLKMVRNWQEDANFKMFDQRSDATRAGWADLQHMATTLRQNEVNQRLANDPELLSSINDAYHQYSSTRDSINMLFDAYKKTGNSPEKLAQICIQPGKENLLSQATQTFADHPEVMKDVRSAWLSEKMGKYVSNDGIFNSNAFIGDLKNTGGETLNQLFKPGELADLYRSAKIMGSLRNKDISGPAEGKTLTNAIGDFVESGGPTKFSEPGTWLKWIQNKPQLSDYLSSPDGLQKIAADKNPWTARLLMRMSNALKDKFLQAGAVEAIKNSDNEQNKFLKASGRFYNKFNPTWPVNIPPVQSEPTGTSGNQAAVDQAMSSSQ